MELPEDAPEAQYQQAKSAYELASSTYERMKNLFDQGGISKQDLDSAETQYIVSKANWDAVQQMLKIRAPISGFVTALNVRETDGVKGEDVLAIISETSQLKAKIWVTENEIGQIKPGQLAEARWNDIILEGRVSEVAMAMDIDHNAFAVDLTFNNESNLCKSGVVSDINVITYQNPSAFKISRKTVKKENDDHFIYIVRSDKAVKTAVEIGHQKEDFEILAGISPGDSVIVEGLNLISDGAKVKVIE
jgi:RND family efflux transporter MFP subunit